MAIRIGFQGKLRYKVGGQDAGGSWLPLDNVQDVESSLESEEADATTRGLAATGFRATVPTLSSGEISFTMVWDTADAGFTALKNAYFAKGKIGIQALDGDTPGSQGIQGDFAVINFSRNEPLAEVMTVSVTSAGQPVRVFTLRPVMVSVW